MEKEKLIQNPKCKKPHVVLLGAGASRAAFPKGDAAGKKLPVMNDFVDVLELNALLKDAHIDTAQNFESIYSSIKDAVLRKAIEEGVNRYFSALNLPETTTDYDRLLLSLREKDAIFSFNWDPFLFNAWVRNRTVAKLPEIFFLHGNVCIGSCISHKEWGKKFGICSVCNKRFSPVPLLYPIEKKNYSENANEYIKAAWYNAKYRFADAFTITIFGYGAPTSDTEAVELLKLAWFKKSSRQMEHLELIDIEKEDVLSERWNPFAPTRHYQIIRNLSESRLLGWPRRSCEALFYPMSRGEPCEAFPLPATESLSELHEYIKRIARYEK